MVLRSIFLLCPSHTLRFIYINLLPPLHFITGAEIHLSFADRTCRDCVCAICFDAIDLPAYANTAEMEPKLGRMAAWIQIVSSAALWSKQTKTIAICKHWNAFMSVIGYECIWAATERLMWSNIHSPSFVHLLIKLPSLLNPLKGEAGSSITLHTHYQSFPLSAGHKWWKQ